MEDYSEKEKCKVRVYIVTPRRNPQTIQETSQPPQFEDRRHPPSSAMLGLKFVPSWLVREALENEFGEDE